MSRSDAATQGLLSRAHAEGHACPTSPVFYRLLAHHQAHMTLGQDIPCPWYFAHLLSESLSHDVTQMAAPDLQAQTS